MSSNEIYDVTPREREVIEWRDKRRLELRNQYLKEIHNPKLPIEGYLFDPQMQRFYTATFAYERISKPTIPNFLWFVAVTFGSIGFVTWRVKSFRDKKEHRYRTGQVSYRDRDWKFV